MIMVSPVVYKALTCRQELPAGGEEKDCRWGPGGHFIFTTVNRLKTVIFVPKF
jgi:hypothetical protein